MERLSISFLLNESSNLTTFPSNEIPVIKEEQSQGNIFIGGSETKISNYITPVIGNNFDKQQPILNSCSSFQQILQNKVEKAMRSAGSPKTKPYSRKEERSNQWLASLRVQTYCSVLSSPVKQDEEGNKYKCTFSDGCNKIIKGKGNLRRHVEWHLRRIEDDAVSNPALKPTFLAAINSRKIPMQDGVVADVLASWKTSMK